MRRREKRRGWGKRTGEEGERGEERMGRRERRDEEGEERMGRGE